MSSTDRILVVEDDLRLSKLIKEYLSNYGYNVATEERGDVGLQRILFDQPDLVILDLMLPGMDGLEVCQKARHTYPGPILILTAREDDTDQVVGLELGADDYVKKPIDPRILLARIRAILRRSSNKTQSTPKTDQEAEKLIFNSLCIDRTSHTVTLQGEVLTLTTNEFALLWALASRSGTVLEREELFKMTRGIPYDGSDRSVDITISRLRKKLQDNSEKPWRIKTIWGQGYLFVKDAWKHKEE